MIEKPPVFKNENQDEFYSVITSIWKTKDNLIKAIKNQNKIADNNGFPRKSDAYYRGIIQGVKLSDGFWWTQCKKLINRELKIIEKEEKENKKAEEKAEKELQKREDAVDEALIAHEKEKLMQGAIENINEDFERRESDDLDHHEINEYNN